MLRDQPTKPTVVQRRAPVLIGPAAEAEDEADEQSGAAQASGGDHERLAAVHPPLSHPGAEPRDASCVQYFSSMRRMCPSVFPAFSTLWTMASFQAKVPALRW